MAEVMRKMRAGSKEESGAGRAVASKPLFPGAHGLIQERAEAGSDIKRLQKRVAVIDEVMEGWLRENGVRVGTWRGKSMAMLVERVRYLFDVKMFRTTHPEMVDEFTRPYPSERVEYGESGS